MPLPRMTVFEWEGVNRQGQPVRGESRAMGDNQVKATLRRQGITAVKVARQRVMTGRVIRSRDISAFTRQLATLHQAGVPLLQCFEVAGRGHGNPRLRKLLQDIRADVETGTSLSNAFRKHPAQFNTLYCNLVGAGEAAGILDDMLARLAVYMEKTEAMKSKIKAALTYPAAVLAVAFAVIAVILVFVIPAFKSVFSSFGADLPAPTLWVMGISDFCLAYGGWMAGLLAMVVDAGRRSFRRSVGLQRAVDRGLLKVPVFGSLLEKACMARWTRTLSTMLAAGVPLMEALDSVAGTSGNSVFALATDRIGQDISRGGSLSTAMGRVDVFPNLLIQMCAIGEESGSLDHMLGKAADFFEAEVDEKIAVLSSLMEPFIIVFLGVVIGAIVVSMYLPIFKLGQVV